VVTVMLSWISTTGIGWCRAHLKLKQQIIYAAFNARN
jgi:hypothetical protein